MLYRMRDMRDVGLRPQGLTETRLSIFGLVIACMALMIGSALAQGTDVEDDSEGDRIVSIDKGAAAEKLAKDQSPRRKALRSLWK